MVESDVEDILGQLQAAIDGGPFRERRLGRALAFQVLYEMDQARHPTADVLARLAERAGDLPAGRFARALVEGVLVHRREIDGVIQERATAWPLAQMAAVDRNVLRLGLYETLFGDATVPLKAAINEAVELAKLFGSETSAKFVNGVLGRAVESSPRHSAMAGPAPTTADPVSDQDDESPNLAASAAEQ